MIRPLLPDDVAPSQRLTARALDDLDRRRGELPQPVTEERATRVRQRIAHLQRTDPEGAWVAEVGGAVAGCALALVRDGMWFLSLLMVDPPHQGTGLGRGLLRAALNTATDRSWILSSADPSALRGYQRSGFALHPSYTAKGPVDRSKIPAVQGIREGSYDDDRDLINAIASATRGASLGPDVDYLHRAGGRLIVDVGGRGWCVVRAGGISWLAALDDDVARRLLWTGIGEAGSAVEIDWLTAAQQWAIDVSLDAGLPLAGGASLCFRGQPPVAPYLPHGALG